jgi:hypothetical protein
LLYRQTSVKPRMTIFRKEERKRDRHDSVSMGADRVWVWVMM